jgi:Tol biopolymer transport system component
VTTTVRHARLAAILGMMLLAGLLVSSPEPAGAGEVQGRLFLATVWSPPPPTPSRSVPFTIEVLDSAGKVVRVLSRATWSLAAPLWSPGRWRLAWDDGAGIWVERADGSEKRLLLPAYQRGDSNDLYFKWSPDGRQLLVGGAGRSGNRLVVVDAASGATRDVVPNPRLGHSYQAIGWSPDGHSIAYGYYSGAETSALVVAHPDGSDARTLFTFVDSHDGPGLASWSPNGRSIAFVTDARDPRDPAFARIDVATGVVHRISKDSGCEEPPAWSPDGTRIAIARTCRGPIVTVSPFRHDIRPLGFDGDSIDWEPDGRLYIQSGTNPDGDNVLYATPSWTREPRLLFQLPRGQVFASLDPA